MPSVEWVQEPPARVLRLPHLEQDACLPFKRMIQQAVGLVQHTDALLVPRMVNVDGYLMCPNFRALPDMVALNCKKIYSGKKISLFAPLVVEGDAYAPSVLAKQTATETSPSTASDTYATCRPSYRATNKTARHSVY